jgi:hypothetical protein
MFRYRHTIANLATANLVFALTLLCLFSSLSAFAQKRKPLAAKTIPSPESVLGFKPTSERTIADWKQISDYFAKLDAASDRVKAETLGETTLKKPFIAAFISSAENIRDLAKYKQINQKLADPRKIKSEAELQTLLTQGKTIVAISCSIHSTEIVASQMSMNLAFEMATATDEATREILSNTILLLIPSANPDGIDIVADWYRKTLNTKFEGSSPPELYHHYAGHDNNRDWFMLNLPETRHVTKLFWQEWFPHIVYDVHQMGQNGARFVIPPFFDPPNPNIPPLILREVGLIGYKMAADLQAAGVSGVATNTTFDTWWHGGFRSAPYYRNSIGILSEAASANLMTPVTVTEEKMRGQRARGLNSPLETSTAHPLAWRPGAWGPQNIAQIEMIASRSLLTLAAKFRGNYLRNFFSLNQKAAQEKSDPRHPAAYVITAGQSNTEAVARLLEILTWQGIEVYRMKNELHAKAVGLVGIHEFPLNSYFVPLDQPQRSNVEALFGNQVYPQRLAANGEAEVPYDVAGWTLPLQMGVETHILLDIIEPPELRQLEKITDINTARKYLDLPPASGAFAKLPNPLKNKKRIGLYRGFAGSMDEGWTRLALDNHQIPFSSVSDADVRKGGLAARFDRIILPAQSEREIVDGLNKNDYPEELTGGITAAGVENLRRFVEDGGTLICFDDSCEMLIKRFNLPVKNVLAGLKRNEFYCPGSILQLQVDTDSPLARGLFKDTAAYFINSAAFEITDPARVRSVATYAQTNALLSGFLLGEKYLSGKTALAETDLGKGKIVLFAFRPQHRGQTWGTFPFIFNALD